MNARIVGNGEVTMVLSHGYGGSQSVWDDILPLLTDRYRVLLFDWSFSGTANPSCGAYDSSKYSSFVGFADDLISLLDRMKLEKVVFVGHSMAGMVGCLASVKRPDLFSHLVLIGASPRYLNSEDYEGGFNPEDIENILSNIEFNFLEWAKAFAELVVGENSPKSVQKFTKSLQMMEPHIALSLARTIFFVDLRSILEMVELPCIIIQGTKDIVAPVSVAGFMKSKMKGKVKVEIIEADAHFPQLTSPKVLVDILDTHLMQTKEF